MSHDRERTSGTERLVAALTWTLLLFGLWLWGRGLTGVPHPTGGPTTGNLFALAPAHAPRLPAPAKPLGDAVPQRVDIPQLGVQAPVVRRGLDAQGAVDPPPFDQPGVVGWYGAGTAPGARGAALLVGHVDTETRPAVFYKLSTLKPGETVRVVRSDGKVARFTIDDVRVLPRAGFDAHQAYAPHRPGRAELRLITCGGSFDRAAHSYTANVVVSAYLTGTAG
ncbi:class F sortase [Streptomyces barringtoniae]|uniref:class F sortase n=1 Tax=Streptomyces barringtoniae TaxID=2892029 RepID=UPI001E2B66D2|nr:class F sortase [Streptomyces barringtoniae]MCC5477396.1 class F sortase [Streptomyces barringtoniae]